MSQFHALQSQLAARLRTRLDAAGHSAIAVLGAPQATSLDGPPPAPCIFIAFDGYTIAEASASRTQARLAQQWSAIICVRHSAASAAAQTAIDLAGELADLTLAALIGWHPSGYASPTVLTGAAKPDRDDGHYWLPIGFEAMAVYKATP